MIYHKQCENCKQDYISEHFKTKYCGSTCREFVKIKKSNDLWMRDKKYIRPNNQAIEYSRVSKKPIAWMKKFQSCRG